MLYLLLFNPRSESSSFTLSIPILSSLSIATVISTNLSATAAYFCQGSQNLTVIDFYFYLNTEVLKNISINAC